MSSTSSAQRLLNSSQLNVKDEGGIWRNGRSGSLRSVSHGWWAGDASLAADLHASHTDVPALDHFTAAQLEGEALAGLGAVEHFVVGLQASFVVNLMEKINGDKS